MVIERLVARWRQNPPDHPVIVAGSTGSRLATFRLMEAVAQLPQGAVILPGLDSDMPKDVWRGLLDGRRDGLAGEDHPQYRLAKFLDHLGIAPETVPAWSAMAPGNPARNRVVSLALRPAPVTDQWRVEGPALSDLDVAFRDVTVLEAPAPQVEATAIALRLREAIETGQRAALVTPDRNLSRMVAAQLDRWEVVPDDSGGQILANTAPGRLLCQIAEAMATPMTAESLIALLKHPLAHSTQDRGPHLLRTSRLELAIRRQSMPFPTPERLHAWADAQKADDKAPEDAGLGAWVTRLSNTLLAPFYRGAKPLADRVARHRDVAAALAAGPDPDDDHPAGELFDKEPGREADKLLADLARDAPAGGPMTARDYADFFAALAHDREVRSALRPHADVLFWGTQEARVQGADVTILAGLNEGAWPGAPDADPWLNRALRAQVGLRLPDRVIGLSAHDFQQGIAGREIWLTRSRRTASEDTVPSRWLNRLLNLMDGASDASAQAITEARSRGGEWIDMARALTRPTRKVPPAPRPAPAPRGGLRLTYLTATDFERLIRDPYSIYAHRVLGLRALSPLRAEPDARLRGTVVHGILQEFLRAYPDGPMDTAAETAFQTATMQVLTDQAPWQAIRTLWHQRMARLWPVLATFETDLRAVGRPWKIEERHKWDVPGLSLTISATPDRIDQMADGRIAIYDYKTGTPPTAKEVTQFSRQLWIECLMAENGAISEQPLEVARLAFIGLGSKPELRIDHPDPAAVAENLAGLHKLIGHYRQKDVGFVSRRAPRSSQNYVGDFDHLARYGEWDDPDDATLLPVGASHDK